MKNLLSKVKPYKLDEYEVTATLFETDFAMLNAKVWCSSIIKEGSVFSISFCPKFMRKRDCGWLEIHDHMIFSINWKPTKCPTAELQVDTFNNKYSDKYIRSFDVLFEEYIELLSEENIKYMYREYIDFKKFYETSDNPELKVPMLARIPALSEEMKTFIMANCTIKLSYKEILEIGKFLLKKNLGV